MDKSTEAGWPDSPMHLSSDPGGSVFPSPFDSSSHSFADAAYPGSESISGFAHSSSESFPHAASASASYDSLPASLSTGQIYEVSSNDSSGLSSSVFTDTLGSSSVTSSLTGTGPDSLSDVPSRKASLSSSIHDGPLPNHLGHSPEYEDSNVLAATAVRWPTTSVSGVQSNPPYDLRYSNASSTASNSALTPSSFYTSSNIGAGTSSQAVNPYTYTDTLQLMTPSSLSSLRLSTSSAASSQHLPTSTASTSSVGPSHNYSVQPLYTTESDAALQSTRSRTGSNTAKPRNRTSGSTRRAKFRRSRTGCMVCRKRKVKCDQDGQPCKQCRIGKRDCHYEESPPKRKRKSKSKSDSESTRVRRDSSEGAASTLMVTAADLVQSPGQLLQQPEMPHPEETLTEETLLSSTAGKIKEGHDKAEEARRAREEADELTDALFAQHTNFDEADGDDEKTDQEKITVDAIPNQVKTKRQEIKVEDTLEDFTLQYTHDDNLRAPWTSQSNPSASMTAEDWSTNTSSTDPSPNQTTEGDFTFTNLTEGSIEDTLEEKSRIGSPFHKYLGLDDQTDDIIEVTEMNDSWYQGHSIPSSLDSTLPISLSQQDQI